MNTPEYALIAQRSRNPGRNEARNLPAVREEDASPEVVRLYAQFRSRFGRPEVPGILQCFATHPPLLEHMMALSESLLFADGALTRRQKEMIATFVSSSNHCAYCADSHGFFFRVHGGSSESLHALLECDLRAGSLTPKEQTLLAFAAAVNRGGEETRSIDVQRMRDHGWSDLQVAETIHLTALFATFNRVVNAFGLPAQALLSDTSLIEKLPQSGAVK